MPRLCCAGLIFKLGKTGDDAEMGPFALAIVVFVVAMIVVSMRAIWTLDNIPTCFLGLIAFFAAHLEPALEAIAEPPGPVPWDRLLAGSRNGCKSASPRRIRTIAPQLYRQGSI